MKSRINSGNACNQSAQNLLRYRVVSKNLKSKTRETAFWCLLLSVGVRFDLSHSSRAPQSK